MLCVCTMCLLRPPYIADQLPMETTSHQEVVFHRHGAHLPLDKGRPPCISDDGLAVGLHHGPADDGAAHDEELPEEPSGHLALVLLHSSPPLSGGGGGNPRTESMASVGQPQIRGGVRKLLLLMLLTNL